MCEVHKISHLIQNKLIEFIVKNDSKKSHFKQAAFWNIRELNMETNFKRPKNQAQITAKQGVFKIIELRKGKINLVCIGSASHEGLFDAIVNGLHYNGKTRAETLPQQLLRDETDALDIYWFVTEPPLSPKAVESEMIEDYCYGGGKMPKWNR